MTEVLAGWHDIAALADAERRKMLVRTLTDAERAQNIATSSCVTGALNE